MKWYQHQTNTDTSGLVTELVEAGGITQYGLWFRLLEIIAAKCQSPDWCTALRLTRAGWCRRLYCTDKDLQTFMDVVQEYAAADMEDGLQPPCTIKDGGRYIEIDAPRILQYADRYTLDKRNTKHKKQTNGTETANETPRQPAGQTVEKPAMVCTENVRDCTENVSNCTETVIKGKERKGKERKSSPIDGEATDYWEEIPDWLVNLDGRPGALQQAFGGKYDWANPNPYLVATVQEIMAQHTQEAILTACRKAGINSAHSVGYLWTVLENGKAKAQPKICGAKATSSFAYNTTTHLTRLFKDGDVLAEGEIIL